MRYFIPRTKVRILSIMKLLLAFYFVVLLICSIFARKVKKCVYA